MAVRVSHFFSSFCIYRSAPNLTGIYSCLLTVVDQDDVGMRSIHSENFNVCRLEEKVT